MAIKKDPNKVPYDDPGGQGRAARQKKILDALRVGTTRRAAQQYARVPPGTWHKWMTLDPEFREAVEEAEATAEVKCTVSLMGAAQKDWRAALAWLERRRRDDWKRVDDLNIRDLSTEQILNLIQALESGDESKETPMLPAHEETDE